MKPLFVLVGVSGALLLIAGCLPLGQSQAPPVIVNNTTSDGGSTVLLAVAGMGLIAFVLISALLAIWGASEHRRRRDAELVVRPLLAQLDVRAGSVIEGVAIRPELLAAPTVLQEVRR